MPVFEVQQVVGFGQCNCITTECIAVVVVAVEAFCVQLGSALHVLELETSVLTCS